MQNRDKDRNVDEDDEMLRSLLRSAMNDTSDIAYPAGRGAASADGDLRILAHYALPQSWGMSYLTKIRLSAALVLLLIAAAITGIVLQIQTTASTKWQCAVE